MYNPSGPPGFCTSSKVVLSWISLTRLAVFWSLLHCPPLYHPSSSSSPVYIGTVISPDRKNPKKQSIAASHSIKMSVSLALADHKLWICSRIAGVMRSLTCIARGVFCECTLLILACTSLSRGRDDYFLGSGSPSVICIINYSEYQPNRF